MSDLPIVPVSDDTFTSSLTDMQVDYHQEQQEDINGMVETETTTATTGKDDDIHDELQLQQQDEVDMLLDPSFQGRKQMEMRAHHLIQKVELIETKTQQGRHVTASFLRTFDNTNNMDMDAPTLLLPPRLLSLSTTSTASCSTTDSSTNYNNDNYTCHESSTTYSNHNDISVTSSSTSSLIMPIDGINNWMNDSTASYNNLKYDDADSPERSSVIHNSQPQNGKHVTFHHDSALADDLSSSDDTTTSTSRNESTHDELEGTNVDDVYYKNRIDELEKENAKLRQIVSSCSQAAINIQTNIDLKMLQLQLEIVQLNEQLHNEMGINSKMSVLNASLRKQLNVAASGIVQNKNENKLLFCNFISLHQRELTTEKHLNTLILGRNQTMKELTELKRLVLSSCCYSCRQCLVPRMYQIRNSSNSINQRRKTTSSSSSSLTYHNKDDQLSAEHGALPVLQPSRLFDERFTNQSLSSAKSSSHRNLPSYQSSARQLVSDQQHQLAQSSSSISSINSGSTSTKKLKSCLKKSSMTNITVDSPYMNNDKQSSPTSIATMIIDTLPNSLSIGTKQRAEQIDTYKSMSTVTSIASGSGFDNTELLHHPTAPYRMESSGTNHTNEHDAWSSPSDMSVSTTQRPMNWKTTRAIRLSPVPSVQTTGFKTHTATTIPDATMQRKLDLQRHDTLLQFSASRHGSTAISTSSISTNQTKEQSQQQRHRFFGLRRKKEQR